MPAQRDLTGETIGRLTVLGQNGKVQFGRLQTAWLCRCTCGAEITVAQDRLQHKGRRKPIPQRHAVDACPACRARPCVICGTPIEPPSTRVTCSDECALAHERSYQLAWYHRERAHDADVRAKRLEYARRRWREDAAHRERHNENRRRSRERENADPARRAARNERARARYAASSEEVQRRRRERLDSLSPAQMMAWLERARAYGRAYRRRWREELRADPERHQAFRDLMAEYRARRQFTALLAEAASLTTEEGDDGH